MTNSLSHLRALQAFDVVARHTNLTKAADVLNVTHGAVSRQIKILEQHLGTALFLRQSGGMVLTPAGDRLFRSTKSAFAELAHGVADVRRLQKSPAITVSLSTSLALKWLVPKLPAFQKMYPDITLLLDTNDTVVDFDTADVDVALRFGVPDWPRLYHTQLAQEELIAVASPAVVGDANLPLSADAIMALPLLHDGFNEGWTAWAHQVGVNPENISARNTKYVDSAVLLEAAIDRQGVALARHMLAARDLELGRLVRLDHNAVSLARGLYFICRKGDENRKAVSVFQKWLLSFEVSTMT